MKRVLTSISLAVVGLLAMAGTAAAHEASAVPTCDGGVSISFSSFPQGQSAIHYSVTDNGTDVGSGSVAVTGPAGTASGSFTAPTAPGDHAISVYVSWDADGGGKATGSANCPVEAPPPPKDVTVCREGKTVTIPEDQQAPSDKAGECAVVPPPPPPPESVTVCRNGDVITIPESEKQPTDTAECVKPQVQVCLNGDTLTVPVDKQPPGSTEGACKPDHGLGPPELVEALEQQQPEQQPVEAQPQTLPFTGANPALWGLPGLALLALGGMVRRSRWARSS